MILKMYTDYLLNELKTNRINNIALYDSPTSFASTLVSNYDMELYSLDIDVEFPQLDDTIASKENGKSQWEIDFENCVKLHKEFILKYNISLGVLSDERFIAYLTHDVYYNYMQKRWPINGKESRLSQKYFLPTGSQSFTRNLFLKFFWYAYITYNKELEDPYELTRIAFEYADPVNQIMERKYGRNQKIVHAALTAIKNIGSKELNRKRTIYGKTINNILSLYALDVCRPEDLVKLFEDEIKGIVSSSVEDDSDVVEE